MGLKRMKKSIIYLVVFVLLLVSVLGVQKSIVFNETFPIQVSELEQEDLVEFIAGDFTSNSYGMYNGDINWKFVTVDKTTYTLSNISVSPHWGFYDNQLEFISHFPNLLMIYTFRDSVRFTNNTYFEFIGNTSDVGGDSLGFNVYLIDSNGNCTYLSKPNIDVGGCSGFGGYPSADCGTVICGNPITNTEKRITLQGFGVGNWNLTTDRIYLYDANHSTGKINFNDLWFKDIKTIVVNPGVELGGVERAYIDNLVIGNFLNGTNDLPDYTVVFNETDESICINESGDQGIFYFNINSTDSENDTLYYSSDVSLSSKKKKTVDFFKFGVNNLFSQNTVLVSDYSVVADTIQPYNKNVCGIEDSLDAFPISYWTSYTYYLENIYNIDIPVPMLYLNGYCNESEKSYYYTMNENYAYFNYSTRIHNLGINQTGFNISFYNDKLLNKIFELQVLSNGTKNNVYYNDTFLGGFSGGDYLDIFLNIDVANNSYILNVGDNSVSSAYSGSLFSEYYASVIKTSVPDNSQLFQEYFSYQGLYTTPDFSTQTPNNFTFYKVGTYLINIYVSDSANYNLGKYDTYTTYLTVNDCDLVGGSDDIIGGAETDYCFNFPNEYLNGILCIFRVPYIMVSQFEFSSMYSFFQIIIVLVMGWTMYNIYQRQKRMDKDNDEIIKSMFLFAFGEVFVFYFLMLLIPKSIFVIFSVIGLLYLGNLINSALGVTSTDFEKNIMLSTGFFNILSFIYFGFVQVAGNVDFGLPNLAISLSSNYTNIFTKLIGLMSYFQDLIFFSIPDIPVFLNHILGIVRVISIFSLIVVLYNAVNPVVKS